MQHAEVLGYTGDRVYDTILYTALALAVVAMIASRFIAAPYGRFGERMSLPKLHPRWGWMLMELPATLVFWPSFLTGPHAHATAPMFIATVWGVHYLNRGFVFPWLIRAPRSSRSFSVLVIGSGIVVTSLHGWLHGYFVSRYATHLLGDWLTDPRFLVGVALYGSGLALNIHSDAILRNLRSREEVERGERVYRVPMGGGFRFVTNPQYFGELVAWTGFAMVTWSLAGVFILSISLANLVPRAIATHAWYRERFPDYPRDRRALVPLVF